MTKSVYSAVTIQMNGQLHYLIVARICNPLQQWEIFFIEIVWQSCVINSLIRIGIRILLQLNIEFFH